MRNTFVCRLLLAGTLALGGAACAEKTQYEWGNYNKTLLSYYKNPHEVEKFADRLRENVDKAEAAGNVPPGLYAEYGYALLGIGDEQAAMYYFSKEQEAWPEAAYLMGRVISRLNETQHENIQ